MTRGAAYVGAVVLVLLGLFGMPVTAEAAAAQPHITVHLDRTTVTSGTPIIVIAHANMSCDWIVQFHGQRMHTVGRAVRASFIAPDVETRTRLKVAVTCFARTTLQPRAHDAAAAARTGRSAEIVLVRVPAKATVEPPVVVLPPGGVVEPPQTGGNGGLPNTGGPRQLLLELGVGALLVGATLVRLGRRQRAAIASAMPRVAS